MADNEEMEEFGEDEVMVGQPATVTVPLHIRKKALKNKALTVGFNDKELRDFVTGFHKRKKKRRKEAQRQMQEKERLKRIEARKKRKQERELALYGIVLTSKDQPVPGSTDNAGDFEHELEKTASIYETKTYEGGDTMITVTTSDLGLDDDDLKQPCASKSGGATEKSHSLAVKKKPMKRVNKHKYHRGGRKPSFRKKDKKQKNGKKQKSKRQ